MKEKWLCLMELCEPKMPKGNHSLQVAVSHIIGKLEGHRYRPVTRHSVQGSVLGLRTKKQGERESERKRMKEREREREKKKERDACMYEQSREFATKTGLVLFIGLKVQ